ncbi:MAG: hypothetical protein H0W42_11620 [Gemmatimonadaceae bacterium]|nr:hypothetical protein [Gemmatimonadaceae bacterium]
MNAAFLVLSLVAADSNSFIRTNQVGYLPGSPKIAVVCSLDSASFPPSRSATRATAACSAARRRRPARSRPAARRFDSISPRCGAKARIA